MRAFWDWFTGCDIEGPVGDYLRALQDQERRQKDHERSLKRLSQPALSRMAQETGLITTREVTLSPGVRAHLLITNLNALR